MPNTPDFERVYEGISKKIAARVDGYQPGQRIPTIEQLREEYAVGGIPVSATTVKLALTLLGRDGWTRGHQGKGTFVTDSPPIPESPDRATTAE